MKAKLCLLMALLLACAACSSALGGQYRYPAEDERHEGTWLIWPHPYIIVNEVFDRQMQLTMRVKHGDRIWTDIAKALHTGETVHIIAYDESERARIARLLEDAGVDMRRIDFFICPSNDIWARDTGPIFVFDEAGRLVIANFRFDGWGGKQISNLDDAIPQAVADAYGVDIVQIPELVLEGGAIECDGAGTLMAAKSSVASIVRNPDKTLDEVEAILSRCLGVTNFLWIEGSVGEDITDAHIDGAARFINDRQILICSKEEYKGLYLNDPDESDWAIFESATNARGEPYELVHMPLTRDTVELLGQDLGFRGSYINYYVGNEVVLVPQYDDPNDALALDIIGRHYPGREVVGIDCGALIYLGGVIHCITQQQPLPAAR